jgi:subfamily B ATP-binding cassette protein MsbA
VAAKFFRETLYGRLLTLVFPHWKVFLLSSGSTMLLAATEPALPALFKILLDDSFIQQDQTMIKLVPVAMVVLFLVRGLAGYVSAYSTSWVSTRVVTDLREAMFSRLMAVPMAFFDTNPSGVLLSRFTYDVNRLQKAVTTAWVTLVRDSLATLGLLGWMFWLDWRLTLAALVIVPAAGIILQLASKRLRRLNRGSQEQMGELNQIIRENLGAQREIRIFGAEDYEISRFGEPANRVRRTENKLAATSTANVGLIQLLVSIALATLIYIAIVQSETSGLTPGGFVSFFGAMGMLFGPIKRLTRVNDDIQRGLAAAESVFFIIDQQTEQDRADAVPMNRARGEIQFEEVGFKYPGQTEPALTDINLQIPAGSTVALVGASGSGKSTLAGLIPLFLRPQSGRILLDGQDITHLSLKDLRRQIALVSQQVILFNDTVAANIAYGQVEGLGPERLERVAQMAHATEFVDQLPKGMDTHVGENGAQLSGGQRQRLAIARALLKDAPILIMDEATSSLDTRSEQHIQAAIEAAARSRTCVVIAHRLSTIQRADQIVVLDRGRIVETGTHSELLARNGQYAALHRAQDPTEGRAC